MKAGWLAEVAAGFAGALLPSSPTSPLLPQDPSPLVDGTFLGRKGAQPLELAYKATRDGWSALDFHRCVDSKGSALVLCETTSGKKFGGYNSGGWRSSDDYINSTKNFILCQAGKEWPRFPVVGQGEAAVFDYAKEGIRFGADALVIGEAKSQTMGGFTGPDTQDMSAGAGNLRIARVKASNRSYPLDSRMPVNGQVRLRECEVYVARGS